MAVFLCSIATTSEPRIATIRVDHSVALEASQAAWEALQALQHSRNDTTLGELWEMPPEKNNTPTRLLHTILPR